MAGLATKALALDTERFHARCAAARASLPSRTFVPSTSPALSAAIAAMQDHRRRWDAARAETLAAIGCTAAPVADARPALPRTAR